MSDELSASELPAVNLGKLLSKLDDATLALEESQSLAKAGKLPPVFDISRQVLLLEEGFCALEVRAERLEHAGVFEGTDWADPAILLPSLTTYSLQSPNADTVVVEALSELRLLAIARQLNNPIPKVVDFLSCG